MASIEINKNNVDSTQKRLEQIQKILQETAENLQILCNISILTRNNGRILYRFLRLKEAEYVLEILRKFDKKNRTTIEHDIEEDTDNRQIIAQKRVCNDLEFSKIVDLILNSKCIKKYLKKFGKPCEPSMEKFISYIRQLAEIVDRKLNLTAIDEIKIEDELKEAFVENEFLKKRIKDSEEILARQQSQFNKEREQYERSYRYLTEALEKLEEKYNFDIQQLTYESEHSMMQLSIETETVQIQLKEEVEKHQQKYDQLVEKNQKEEKQSRIALSKIETQLSNWVEKYDKDMMEKLADLEALQDEYDQEMAEIQELEDKLSRQNDLYTKLMKEKHDEEERIFQQLLTNFVENRAAKCIQRAWREYLARKRAEARRKKSKKDKKGKKGKKGKK